MWNKPVRSLVAALFLLAGRSAAALPRTVTDAQQAYIVHQPFSMNLGFSSTNTGVLLPFKIDPSTGGLMVTPVSSSTAASVSQSTSPWIVSISTASFGGAATKPIWVTQTGTGGATNIWGTVTANAGTGTFTVSLTGQPNATVTANAGTGTFTVSLTGQPNATFNQGMAAANAAGWLMTLSVTGAATGASDVWPFHVSFSNTLPGYSSANAAFVQPQSGAQVPFSFSITGVGSITNTCYVTSWTLSTTGSQGFIDCRGAASITIKVDNKVATDHAAYGGQSSTLSWDSAFGGYLPTTATDPLWNDSLSPSNVIMTSGTYVIPSPPPFLRLRWFGPTPVGEGQTLSIKYTINFKNGGSNIFEAGPTPPMHGPTP